jgi:hypothetical protein
MAIEVSWDDPRHTILKVELWDWGWEDIARDEAIEERRRMLDASPEPATMVVVIRDAPRNLLGMLPQLSQSPAFSHPNVRQVIIVTASGIIKNAADVFGRVYGMASRRMHVVSSMSEAYQLIAETQQD